MMVKSMKKKKIIYFTSFTFSKWDYERFGIEIMKKNGLSVEVWDLTPFLNPEAYKTLKVPDPIDYKEYNLKLFKRNSDILNQIVHLKSDTIIINLLLLDYRLYHVFKRLSKLNIRYGLLIPNAIPMLRDVSDINPQFDRKKLINFDHLKNWISASNFPRFQGQRHFRQLWCRRPDSYRIFTFTG